MTDLRIGTLLTLWAPSNNCFRKAVQSTVRLRSLLLQLSSCAIITYPLRDLRTLLNGSDLSWGHAEHIALDQAQAQSVCALSCHQTEQGELFSGISSSEPWSPLSVLTSPHQPHHHPQCHTVIFVVAGSLWKSMLVVADDLVAHLCCRETNSHIATLSNLFAHLTALSHILQAA